ncbi:TetR/AcrR family transcriptional regulator [Candidatus Poribacteria bacterium]|nr:TetR/AcrR family transcriptional regulator [Candidatus Poribacteria bacterium]
MMTKEEKRAKRRQEILEAAVIVFSKKGYHLATIGDIASEAGIAQGTMYLYFKSKEDLLVAIFAEKMGEFNQYIKEQIQNVSGADAKLKRLIELHIRAYDAYRGLAQLVLIEMRQVGKFLTPDALTPAFEYWALIQGILDEGVKAGVFLKELDTMSAATMLYSSIGALATRWVLEDFSYSILPATEAITRIFFRGILTTDE